MNYNSTNSYISMSTDEVCRILKTGKEGLTAEEANERLKTYGFNEIEEAKDNLLLKFLKKYWGPMPWLLEFTIVLTIILKHYSESIIIFVLLTINAVIGFLQSQNTKKAVKLLKSKLEFKSKVFRDGMWVYKEAKMLVPGDVINVKLGDIVPADAYILDGKISADESSLTGESLPKNLREEDVIYSSSIVKGGEARCIIVNTGLKTFFGKTVELVKKARPKSRQEELMFGIVKYMMYLGIAASIIVSIYAVYLNKSFLFILSFVVTFLIGAVPVALPAVLTIVQAVAAMQLSKKGILVTKLDSIEDAASIDIFCFDKTGTITENKLTVIKSVPFEGYNEDDVVKYAALASKEEGMDAIDLSIISFAKSQNMNFQNCTSISYIPFNPGIKRTEAEVLIDKTKYKIIKGAPQIILNLCTGTSLKSKESAEKEIKDFSEKGYRTIAVAVEEGSGEVPKLIGLLAIADPPREDSKKMIAEIKNLGIKPIMLTGDNIAIAQKIAEEVGIHGKIRKISELENLNEEEQFALIYESAGFAEVYPEDKYKIVKIIQDNGHMTGMTGDGVNDSPALKQAELGTAVSGATDVANASASIVLTKPGLSEIISAIKVSRQTYQRMLTWVINKIVKVVEVVILFSAGFFWTHDLVISLLGMSLLIFANDFVTMSIATDNVKSTEDPNCWNMKNITLSSLVLGTAFALFDLFVIFIGLKYFKLDMERLRTLVLLTLVFNTQFRILIVRERKHFWSSMPNKNMLLINIAAIAGFALLGIFGTIIPSLLAYEVLTLIGITMIFIVLLDFIKYYVFKVFHV